MGFETARDKYVAATKSLVTACEDVENGALSGDFDALAGSTDQEKTFAVGSAESAFSSSGWRDHLDGLLLKAETLSAFERDVPEAARRKRWATHSENNHGSHTTDDPDRDAPVWQLTHDNLSEALTMDLERTLDFLKGTYSLSQIQAHCFISQLVTVVYTSRYTSLTLFFSKKRPFFPKGRGRGRRARRVVVRV